MLSLLFFGFYSSIPREKVTTDKEAVSSFTESLATWRIEVGLVASGRFLPSETPQP
jgi:hypothetical protein